MKVDLTKQELTLIKNNLFWCGRVYRNTDVPHGAKLWEPWKQIMWEKINDALDRA